MCATPGATAGDNDPEKANRMAKFTYERLREYLGHMTGDGVPDRWKEISDLVDRFNRAGSSPDKARYLAGCQ